MTRRLLQLYLGLIAFGVSMAMLYESQLGLMPWDVLHQGIALQGGWPMGRVAIVVGALVLLAWIPIRQRPGLGTVSNVIVLGLVFDATVTLVGDATQEIGLPARIGLLLGGIVLNGLATAAYIGARFGPGPRDGLMTGLHRRLGWPIWLVRTLLEGSALVAGWLLGGAVGVGTVAFALLVGPLVGKALPWLDTPLPATAAVAST